jgi:putative ABC transport system ATP-binding protein
VCQKLLKAFSQGNNISLTWAVPLGHACIFALMIDLRGITKSYSTGSQTLQVLKGVDLAVGSGELVAIMGSSGSGKSTLLNILGLLDAYDGGEYKLDGKLVANLSERRAAEMRRELLGFVFQSFNLINFKTASENVALPLYYKKVPRRERTARAHELLERVGLLDWADHLPSQMSGGQKQRVAIARALAANPRVILADEPTGALDSKTSEDVMALLKELNRDGMTMVVVTHEADIAAACQRTIRLRDGVVESGGYV